MIEVGGGVIMGTRCLSADRKDVCVGCACRSSAGELSGGTKSSSSESTGDGEPRAGEEGDCKS